MDHKIFPLGICVFPAPPKNWARTVSYPDYIHEILSHAGVCYQTIALADLSKSLPELKLLLTVGEYALSEAAKTELADWVESGGAWISIAGTSGLANLFGVEAEAPASTSWGGGMGTLGEGYLKTEADHPILQGLSFPLHYFSGTPIHLTDGLLLASVLDAHQRPSNRAGLVEKSNGQGRCLLIAPDITGSVVRIQQGLSVTRDGVPAGDGTAPVADEVLKSGDGGVLDWIFDRQPLDGAPRFTAFLEPIADQLREIVLKSLFYMAQKQNMVLPILWMYPNVTPAIGHLSHDTDANDPELGALLLKTLREAEVKTTWCVILPGYDESLMSDIRSSGCELATHYDALDFPWSEAEFDRQWQQLCVMFGEEKPVSNKNHYLRWEGDTEFFAWCERHGIQIDQSKGASKTGEAGFNFGTCHTYFPVTFQGETLDVLEMVTSTQDLNIFAPEAIAKPLLNAALRHHGIFHLLFHPAHIDKTGVAESLKEAVAAGRAEGLEWWTARQINDWERARRQVRWLDCTASKDKTEVKLAVGNAMCGATLLWLLPDSEQSAGEDGTVVFWGYRFQVSTFNAEAGAEYTFEFKKAGH